MLANKFAALDSDTDSRDGLDTDTLSSDHQFQNTKFGYNDNCGSDGFGTDVQCDDYQFRNEKFGEEKTGTEMQCNDPQAACIEAGETAFVQEKTAPRLHASRR